MFEGLRRSVGRQVLILLVVAGAILLFSDQLLKAGVIAGGRYATGAPVSVGSTDFDVRSGVLQLGELEVANPAGFESPYFLRVRRCEVIMDSPWLGDEPARIQRVVLHGVELQVEQGEQGSNAAAILARLRQHRHDDSSEGGFSLDRIELRDASARVVFAPGLGRLGEVQVELEDVALLDGTRAGETAHGLELAHRTVQRLVDLTLLAVSRSDAFPISAGLEAELRGRLGRVEPLAGDAPAPMAFHR